MGEVIWNVNALHYRTFWAVLQFLYSNDGYKRNAIRRRKYNGNGLESNWWTLVIGNDSTNYIGIDLS